MTVSELAAPAQGQRRWHAPGVSAVAAAAVFVLALDGVRCLDVWFHLRTGQLVAQTGAIPTTDVLSHTRPGAAWITHEWAFEWLLYGVWSVAGTWGLVLFKATLAGVAALLLVRACVRAGAAPLLSAVAVVGVMTVAMRRFQVRPQMASAVCLAGVLWLCFADARKPSRRIWWLVPLFAIWANLHSGFVVGLGIVGAFALSAAARRRRPTALSLVLLGAAAAAMLNPHGWHAFTYPFALLADNAVYALMELRPPVFFSAVHGLGLFVALAAVVAWRENGAAALIVALAGLAIGLSRDRGALEAALMTAPVLAVGLTVVLGRAIERVRPAIAAPLVALAAAAALATVASVGWRPSLEVKAALVPRGAMAFVERNRLAGNMYNSHLFGSWISWAHPQRRVFWDGRNEVYRDLFPEVVGKDFRALVQRYDLGYAVITYSTPSGAKTDFGEVLRLMPGWQLVYFDDVARVFAQRRPGNAAVIARYGYRFLRPEARNLAYVDSIARSANRQALMDEARRAVRQAPASEIARLHLADVLRATGAHAESLRQFRRLARKDSFVWGRIGGLSIVLGDYEASVAALKRAVATNSGNATHWFNLGLAHVKAGHPQRAIGPLQRALAIDSKLSPARALLERVRRGK